MTRDRLSLLQVLGSEQKRLPWHTFSAAGVSICFALVFFIFCRPRLHDLIAIKDGEIVVEQAGRELRFADVKSKLLGEKVQLQATFEGYGVKPNTYEIHRRFLIEVTSP